MSEFFHLHRAELDQLKNFTEIQISRCRQLARKGHKDDARDWLRYLENSQILKILDMNGYETIRMRRELDGLRDECHPHSQPARADDIAEILARLDQLENSAKSVPPE